MEKTGWRCSFFARVLKRCSEPITNVCPDIQDSLQTWCCGSSPELHCTVRKLELGTDMASLTTWQISSHCERRECMLLM